MADENSGCQEDGQASRSWPRRLSGFGGATLLIICMTALSGLYMAFFFTPDPASSAKSVAFIESQAPGGFFAKSLHVWGALFAVILLMAHFVSVCLRGLYAEKRSVWIAGLCMALALSAIIVTGFLTPWNFRSYWIFQTMQNWTSTLPFLSDPLDFVLIDGSYDGEVPVGRWLAFHAILLPLILGICLFFHLRGKLLTSQQERPWTRVLKLWAPLFFACALILVSLFGNIELDAADPVTTTNWPQPSYLLLMFFQITRYCQDSLEAIGVFWLPLGVFLIALALAWLRPAKHKKAIRYGVGVCALILFVGLNIVTHHSQSTSPLDSCAACHKEGFGGAFAATPVKLDDISTHYDNNWLAMHYRYPQFYWMDVQAPPW